MLFFFSFLILCKLLKTHLQKLISDIILSDRRYGLMAKRFSKCEDFFFSGCTYIIPAFNLASFRCPFSVCVVSECSRSFYRPDVAKICGHLLTRRDAFSEGGLFTSHFCLSRSKLANQNVDLSPEGWRQALCAVLGTSSNETVLLIGLSACMTAAPFIAELIGPVAF